MTILIPAYQPNIKLIELVMKIKKACDHKIVIVDDGSGKKYRNIFQAAERMECVVLTHILNLGKGKALKTGIEYIKKQDETEGIVCADCDGQHLPKDILKVAAKVKEHSNSIILGSRRFTGKVPFRSRFGNTITRSIFSFATGQKIYDTQTGLRGFNADTFDWLLNLKGDRFDYEMNMLLEAVNDGYEIYEVEIDTLYQENHSSHFRMFSDSAKVYLPIIKFSGASLISAAIDYLLLLFIMFCSGNLLLSALVARGCSSIGNYFMNKTFVFSKSKNSNWIQSLPKYYALVLIIFVMNYLLLYFFYNTLGMPILVAKIITEIILFIFSYRTQKAFIFKPCKMYNFRQKAANENTAAANVNR